MHFARSFCRNMKRCRILFRSPPCVGGANEFWALGPFPRRTRHHNSILPKLRAAVDPSAPRTTYLRRQNMTHALIIGGDANSQERAHAMNRKPLRNRKMIRSFRERGPPAGDSTLDVNRRC